MQRLKLCYGLFSNLQFAAHLTSLEIVSAQASSESECQFVTSLQDLKLFNGQLAGLHHLGSSACTRLQRLVGYPGSFVPAGSDTDNLDLRMPTAHIPAILCKLANLTELSFTIFPRNHVDLNMQWLYQLTVLQTLHLCFTNVGMTIGQPLTHLSSLSTLSLDSSDCRVEVQWQLKRALQCVTFSGTIDFWGNVFDLLSVKNLQSLTFDEWEPATDDTFKILNFGVFMYKMGVERPNVKLSVIAGRDSRQIYS